MKRKYIQGSSKRRKKRSLIRKYGNKCLSCGKSGDEVILSLDHIRPPMLGGSNKLDNLQLLCVECNQLKDKKIIDYRPF